MLFIVPLTACGKSSTDTPPSISFDGFEKQSDNIYYCKVPNATTLFNFSNSITVANGYSWIVSTDIHCNVLDQIPSKIATLASGDNVFYVMTTEQNGNVEVYKLTIRRRPIYTVAVRTYSYAYSANNNYQTIATQQIEEDKYMDMASVTKTYTLKKQFDTSLRTFYSYKIIGWSFDTTKPITSNTTITASKIEVTEINSGLHMKYWDTLKEITLNSPPMSIYYSEPFQGTAIEKIFVPKESVNAYKSTDGWGNYANKIYAIEK